MSDSYTRFRRGRTLLPRRSSLAMTGTFALAVCALVAATLLVLGQPLVAAAAAVPPVAAAAALLTMLLASRPRHYGMLHLKGAREEIEILRDAHGVPHVRAHNLDDAYFALGVVHAQDRQWQLEVNLRSAQGTLAEVVGGAAVATDRLFRTLGLARAADRAWNHLPEEDRRLVEAYVAGINAVIDAMPPLGRAPEFTLLRTEPTRWRPQDVLAQQKLIAWELGKNQESELLGAFLNVARPVPSTELAADTLPAAGLGSNAWAVAADRSTTGFPVLANDLHLSAGMPSTWYLVRLHAPGLDLIGATIPGMPAVLAGHNTSVAWGITNLYADVQDLYREHLSDEGIEEHHETLRVRKGQDVHLHVRSTARGPIVSDALPGLAREPLSLRWTALDPNDDSLGAWLALNRAPNARCFREALTRMHAPALNFVYADAGTIAYQAAGRIPVRRGAVPRSPTDAASLDGAWLRYASLDELPHAENPPEGFVLNANERPRYGPRVVDLGEEWAPPFRARRIEEFLRVPRPLAVADHAALQNDVVSLEGAALVPRLLACARALTPEAEAALRILAGWRYEMTVDSAAAAVYAVWYRHLVGRVIAERYPISVRRWIHGNDGWRNHVITEALDADRSEGEVAALMTLAFEEAVAELKERLGPRPGEWRWGRLHRLTLNHKPFRRTAPWGWLFSRTVPVGGDASTVNYGAYDASYEQTIAASYRQVINLDTLDESLFALLPGQCAHPLSRHHTDLLHDWRGERYVSIPLEQSKAMRRARGRLVVRPRP